MCFFFFFSSRRRHTRYWRDWSSDVCSSDLCAAAPSVVVLDVLRLVQGLCGAAGIVLARAIVRDRWTGVQMARIYAALMGAVSLGPILAPTIGGALLGFMDWRGLFVVLAGFGVVLLVTCATWVPETLVPERRRDVGLLVTL